MHDALFDNQKGLSEEFYVTTAKNLGLNMDKFNADRNSPAIEQRIKEDIAAAEQLDISGTPGFAVNGVLVKGAYPVEHFKKIIDRWLAQGTAPAKG
jgi:predicted DsbA family dithiol-disulfide isomerase